jgi:predicted nucleic acid-binding protein
VLLLDNSAWARIVGGVLDDQRAGTVAEWIEQRQLATCLPFLLEVGYSAQSGADHKAILDELESFPSVGLTVDTERRAAQTQRELAATGHHRLAPIDIMIAACAHEVGAGVLHYDRHYDILATSTSLQFQSEWLVPPGTLRREPG